MFKKLQNKFLLINMISIFIIILISFVIIYSITYINVKNENKNKLEQISDLTFLDLSDVIEGISDVQVENSESGTVISGVIPNDFAIGFYLNLSSNNEISKINSYIDFSEDQYNKLVKLALENKNSNIIELDGTKWMYKIEEYSIGNVLEANNNTQEVPEIDGSINISSIKSNDTFTQKKITFLNVTESIKSLDKLLITFIFVGLFMTIFIYIVSLYFAKKAIQPVKESWEKQKQFIADASHELKTPIAAINANTDVLLLNNKEKIETQEKWLKYIKIETNRMKELVNKLLQLEKIENKKEKIQRTEFNLSEKLEEIVIPLEALAIEKHIKLKKEIEQNVIIKEDEEIIKRVISILIDNALKYTNANGEIVVSLKRNKKQLEIAVENTGEGIKQNDIPKIFDRFYKVDKSRTNTDNSYGLGLSIAKASIENIGGKIVAQSIENKKTTFTIILED